MLFRNSLNLLMENFKNVYKIALYKFVVTLVAGALCCAIVLPGLLDILSAEPIKALLSLAQRFFPALFSANAETLTALKSELFGADGVLDRCVRLLNANLAGIALSVFGCVVVWLVRRFVDTLCYFSVGDILNDRMSSYSETPFFSSFVSNLGKASRYALFYVPISFLFDLFCLFFAVLLVRFVNVLLALFLAIVVTVLAQSLKLTITGRILPAMTADGKGLFQCFKEVDETEKKQRVKLFSNYFVTVYLVLIVNVVAAFATLGSALILTVPASYFLFICVQYVNYYTLKGKKYFITYDSIATNPDRGDREHFFDYVEETGGAIAENIVSNGENTKL